MAPPRSSSPLRPRMYAMEVNPRSEIRIELEFYGNGRIFPGPVLELTGLARSAKHVSLFNRVDLFRDGESVAYQQPVGSTIAWSLPASPPPRRTALLLRAGAASGWRLSSVSTVLGSTRRSGRGRNRCGRTFCASRPIRLRPGRGSDSSFRRTGSVVYRTEVEVLDLAGRRIGAMRGRGCSGTTGGGVAGEGGLERPPAGVYFCHRLFCSMGDRSHRAG